MRIGTSAFENRNRTNPQFPWKRTRNYLKYLGSSTRLKGNKQEIHMFYWVKQLDSSCKFLSSRKIKSNGDRNIIRRSHNQGVFPVLRMKPWALGRVPSGKGISNSLERSRASMTASCHFVSPLSTRLPFLIR